MLKAKEIFSKYNDDVIELEYKRFNPDSNLYLNAVNMPTTFKIELSNSFISKNIKYTILGKLKSMDSKNPYKDNEHVRLAHNFVGHLFSKIEIRKHGTLIDDIDYPGIASTVKVCVEYSGIDANNSKAINAGFYVNPHESYDIDVTGNLSDLGLGFFSDINTPIYKGDFEIIFFRKNDNDAIYRRKGADASSTTPNEGLVEITTFYLRVPIIEYEKNIKLNLPDELLKNSYFFLFQKWQCIKYTKISGKELFTDLTNVYKNIYDPVWIFVVFQTNRSNTQLKVIDVFDHKNVKNIWVDLNEKRYPKEDINMDWDKNYNISVAYEADQSFKKIFTKTTNSQPYVYRKDFKNRYPIYSIDLSNQPQKISGAQHSLTLNAHFNNDIQPPSNNDEGTFCYVIIISKCILRYEPDKSMITAEYI
jgi:hypothetical protein